MAIVTVLAGLISVAAWGALNKAKRFRIKAEVDQISEGFELYHIRVKAYPPNCQFGSDLSGLRQHLKKAFPRHRENKKLIWMLLGARDPEGEYTLLDHGISASEAIVFWMGGFSDDPQYPISGEGGPSYLASLGKQDPIESRNWVFPCEVSRLIPRDSDGYFDGSDHRYVEYPDPRFPEDRSKRRRINFWQYAPRNSQQPYLYFDVSRGDPTPDTDPFAWTRGNARFIYAIKSVRRIDSNGSRIFKYANDGKFQILHCGIDDAWGDPVTQVYGHIIPYPGPEYQNILRQDCDLDGRVTEAENKMVLVFPDGPFLGDLADTVVNFTTATRIDDAQTQ